MHLVFLIFSLISTHQTMNLILFTRLVRSSQFSRYTRENAIIKWPELGEVRLRGRNIIITNNLDLIFNRIIEPAPGSGYALISILNPLLSLTTAASIHSNNYSSSRFQLSRCFRTVPPFFSRRKNHVKVITRDGANYSSLRHHDVGTLPFMLQQFFRYRFFLLVASKCHIFFQFFLLLFQPQR